MVLRLSLIMALLLFVSGSFMLHVNMFKAVFQGSDICLDWQVNDEQQIMGYGLYRKQGDETMYSKLTNVMPNGSGAYSFIGESLNQITGLSYRITIKDSQGNYQYFSTLKLNTTAIERSWGSIRCMFK